MSTQNSTDITKKFELEGSSPHYPASLLFTIDYMLLLIEPNLKHKEGNLINCIDKLDITAKQDINEIELDIAELKIHSVSSSADLCRQNKNNNNNNDKELSFIPHSKKDKLTIKLAEPLSKDNSICITIKYSAGVYDSNYALGRKPRSGFNFVQPDKYYYPDKNLQAWTQGETIESRYWFPCLDDPQVRFPREIHVIVPQDYIVISNGDNISNNPVKEECSDNNEMKTEWIWREEGPISTYLTSVVIGTFSEAKDNHKDPYYSVDNGNVFTEQSIQAAEELGKEYKSRTTFDQWGSTLRLDLLKQHSQLLNILITRLSMSYIQSSLKIVQQRR